MALHRRYPAIVAVVVLAAAWAYSACAAIVRSVRDAIDFVIEVVASPFKPALAVEGLADIAPTPGRALDRALQHDLRHEAGFSRRSAARHI